jgi:hypothetical protein
VPEVTGHRATTPCCAAYCQSRSRALPDQEQPCRVGRAQLCQAGAAHRMHVTGSITLPHDATKLLPFFDHDRAFHLILYLLTKCLDVAAVLNSRRVPRRQDRCTDNCPGREDPTSRPASSAPRRTVPLLCTSSPSCAVDCSTR